MAVVPPTQPPQSPKPTDQPTFLLAADSRLVCKSWRYSVSMLSPGPGRLTAPAAVGAAGCWWVVSSVLAVAAAAESITAQSHNLTTPHRLTALQHSETTNRVPPGRWMHAAAAGVGVERGEGFSDDGRRHPTPAAAAASHWQNNDAAQPAYPADPCTVMDV